MAESGLEGRVGVLQVGKGRSVVLLSEEMASSKPKRERDSPAQDEDTMR